MLRKGTCLSCVDMRALPSADYSPRHDMSIRLFSKICCDFISLTDRATELCSYGSRLETTMVYWSVGG